MTFVVAEAGINCNGSIDIAKQLIDAAKWAGADAVKFQKRTVEVVYEGQLDQPRESPWGTTLGQQKHGLEFGSSEYDLIAAHCKRINMPWFASAWDIGALEFLKFYDCSYNKIASAMLTNDELVKAVGAEKKKTFISTGLSSYGDINHALDIIRMDLSDITLMHCVGSYPCPESDLNLRMIEVLRNAYPKCQIGYSGHETSVSPSVMAVVLGATTIERHITLDRSMYGSDQAASLEPHGFKTMVEQIRKIPTVLGDGVKRITEAETTVAKKLRYWL